MVIFSRTIKRLYSIVLALAIMMSLIACGSSAPTETLSDPNSQIEEENIEVENVEVENTDVENIYTEFITEEIYTEEIVEVENRITEMLLEEEVISEVLECKTVYVPQDRLEDFAKHSQTAGLFGDEADLGPVLKKVAVGTGVIVTLVVLKRVGLPDPIASVVVAAADKSLQFGADGAAIGSLFGGLTGATNEIDQSGRTSAIIGFATATVGLVLSIVSLVVEAPSGGLSTVTLSKGIKLVIAGVSVVAASSGTVYAGKNAIKTFTSTDGANVDWGNIDWDEVGASSVEKAIQNGADGYMWGSIIGAVYGGAEGYEFYHKYNTPYTDKKKRLDQTPKEGSGGHWKGDRGESEFILDEPLKNSKGEYVLDQKGNKITKITYKNGVPDFSNCAVAEVKIPHMTNKRLGTGGNYEQANEVLADYWTQIKHEGRTWTARDVETYRVENNLTWHEMSNMESMQLVPYDVNHTFTHLGGVAEYNAMTGQEGGTSDFD